MNERMWKKEREREREREGEREWKSEKIQELKEKKGKGRKIWTNFKWKCTTIFSELFNMLQKIERVDSHAQYHTNVDRKPS